MKKKHNYALFDILKKHNKLLNIMKLTFLLNLFCLVAISSSSFSQSGSITLHFQNTRVKDILKEIENQSSYRFFYNDQLSNVNRVVDVSVKQSNIQELLSQLFEKTDITYTVLENNLIVVGPKKVIQVQKVTGIVTDATNGDPIIGANVIIEGTTNGTITDADGRFSLDLPQTSAVLVISYLGYNSERIEVGASSELEIKLIPDIKNLDEVVVVGYGSARKKDLTGALTRISAEDKATLPNISAVQTIRGGIAGIRVTDNGKAGSDGTIVIRGTTSLLANVEPLLVLDGIPMVGTRLSDISSNDIESIDILKDASSAAIYGSRATNGVILITTKRGKDSKPVFNYSGYYGFTDFAHTPKMMGPDKYLKLKEDAAAYAGQPVTLNPIEQEMRDAGLASNPWEMITQDAPMMNHDLSVSGKTDRVNYYFSGSYADQKSIIMGDEFKRMTLRGNFDIKVTDWMNIGTNTGYTFRDNSGTEADIGMAFMMSPYAKYRYDDGQPVASPMGDQLVGNPLFNTLWVDNLNTANNLFSNIYTDIKLPLEGLTFRLNVANNLRYSEVKNHTPSYNRDGIVRASSSSQGWYKGRDFTFENILKYNGTFNNIHNVDATLMYGTEASFNTGVSAGGTLMFSDAQGYYGLGLGDVQTARANASESKSVSGMARVGYRLLDRYMFNFTVRRDGYSAFGSSNKYGNFPSVGLGWVISEEKFLSDVKWLEFLKLRYSYGKNGNRGISAYSSLNLMDIRDENNNFLRYVYGDGGATSNGVGPIRMANPDLGWETTLASNYGIDFNLFSGRISGSVEYYIQDTKDLLINARIPSMTGYRNIDTNNGSLNNKGIEVTLNTVNLKKGGFEWNTTITFTKNVNEITGLMDINGDGIDDDDITNRRFIGKPINSAYDYVYDGIWQDGDDFSIDPSAKPGFIKFRDISGPDGVPDGKIDPFDRQVQDSRLPDYTAGLANSFSYKGITLMVLLYTSQGGKASNYVTNPGSNYYARVNQLDLPYWTPENPLTNRPSVGYPNPKGYGFYEDLSFIRLQDVSLSFDFPKAWTTKMKLGNLRVFVSGKNLMTWTDWHGWDPEHGASIDPFSLNSNGDPTGQSGPLMKSYVFGLNLNF